ncbi:hypothetical protein Tco_0262642 [Tanacetum coccineum]
MINRRSSETSMESPKTPKGTNPSPARRRSRWKWSMGSLNVAEGHATIRGYEGSVDMKEGESPEPIYACHEGKRKLIVACTIVFLSSLVFRSGDTIVSGIAYSFAHAYRARRQIKIPEPVDIGDHDQESIATSVEVKICSNITRVLEHKRHGSYRVAVEVRYTNDGKSTLLDQLTRANILAEERLFVTHDLSDSYPNHSLGWVNVQLVANAHIQVEGIVENPSAKGICADDKPFAPTFQVSNEKAKSLGIDYITLEQGIKETFKRLKEKNFVKV